MTVAVKRDVIDAFKSVGIDEERAWKAAEALSARSEETEGLLERVRERLSAEIADVRKEIADVRKEIAELRNRFVGLEGKIVLVQWMTGTMIALMVGMFIKLFTI